MSECILCQVRRAEKPFYIESTGLNIYSVEELIYFMISNLPLLDQEFMTGELIRWIKDELRMKRLAQNLVILTKQEFRVRDTLLMLYREGGYPDAVMMKKALEELTVLESRPSYDRIKRKGDTLVKHRRFLKAADIYQNVLDMKEKEGYGAQYMGVIYNNIGYVYAKMFQMEEAVSYFRQAYELLHTKASLKSYLYAVYLKDGEKAYRQLAEEAGLDAETEAEMERELSGLKTPRMPEDLEDTLRKWVDQYHLVCE